MVPRAMAYFIPAASFPCLCEVAELSPPGEPGDRFHDVLDAATDRRIEFGHSGEFVAVALSFLDEQGVHLYAAHQEKAERLSARREATHVIFTRGLRRSVLARFRTTRIDVRELVRYEARLRGSGPPADAALLKAAIRFLHDVLRSVRPGEEAVLVIRPALACVAYADPVERPRGFPASSRAQRVRTAF
jgi:hypothetical protein